MVVISPHDLELGSSDFGCKTNEPRNFSRPVVGVRKARLFAAHKLPRTGRELSLRTHPACHCGSVIPSGFTDQKKARPFDDFGTVEAATSSSELRGLK